MILPMAGYRVHGIILAVAVGVAALLAFNGGFTFHRAHSAEVHAARPPAVVIRSPVGFAPPVVYERLAAAP
jgi:hypothetical protein